MWVPRGKAACLFRNHGGSELKEVETMDRNAELHPAYVWDCEDCGSENFQRAIVRSLTEDEQQEILEGSELSATFVHCAGVPNNVICKVCGSKFVSIDQWAMPDDEDGEDADNDNDGEEWKNGSLN
jgi:hypothetical protein